MEGKTEEGRVMLKLVCSGAGHLFRVLTGFCQSAHYCAKAHKYRPRSIFFFAETCKWESKPLAYHYVHQRTCMWFTRGHWLYGDKSGLGFKSVTSVTSTSMCMCILLTPYMVPCDGL